MNSLIAMGALTSFAAGLATPLVPGLALDGSALEEPIMLLAFVLLGRTLEARARLKASGAFAAVLVQYVGCSVLRPRSSLHTYGCCRPEPV